MLVDEIVITVEGGHGGPGRVSFHRPPVIGPDGGNGGRGGDVFLQATTDLMALNRYTSHPFVKADNGEMGGHNLKIGKNGQNRTFLVPVGSSVLVEETGETLEITSEDQLFVIAKGGLGGRGNFEFRSPRNTTPRHAQPGLPGEKKTLQITLKLIADYGLIGLPNAGKSSLLNELTAANVKVANYAFTTLEPNLGVFNRKVLADIPGLIEGAAEGKGLGIKFLKHIEKTSTLLHCIAADSENPTQDYQTIWKELEDFDPALKAKKEIILITKSDVADLKKIKGMAKLFKGKKILPVSIYDYDSIEKLKQLLKN